MRVAGVSCGHGLRLPLFKRSSGRHVDSARRVARGAVRGAAGRSPAGGSAGRAPGADRRPARARSACSGGPPGVLDRRRGRTAAGRAEHGEHARRPAGGRGARRAAARRRRPARRPAARSTPSVRPRVDALRDRARSRSASRSRGCSDGRGPVRRIEARAGARAALRELQSRSEAMTVLATAGRAGRALICHSAFGDHSRSTASTCASTRGEVFGLLGPNGAGKTTTIRMINTLLPLQDGRIAVFGLDVPPHADGGAPAARLRARSSCRSRRALTGRENVTLFARLFDVPRSRAARAGRRGARRRWGSPTSADRLAGTYSGGMIRRLELAQALVNRPRAAGARRADRRPRPRRPRRRLAAGRGAADESGMTVLLTTHYMEEADGSATGSRSCTWARSGPMGRPRS